MNLKAYVYQQRGAGMALARAVGVPAVTIYHWANGKRPIPISRCPAIERATGGAVTRQDLRPDDWHLIWPELAQREASHD